MASQSSLSEEDFSCTVCLDIFKDPVVLLCSHSFCKGCLQTWWREKQIKECPVCKEISSMDRPPFNLALRKLCEAFIHDRHQRVSTGSEDLCNLQAETFKTHSYRPINDATLKEIRKSLKTFQNQLKVLNKVRSTHVQTAEHINAQARDTKSKIKEQFQKLHQFLQEEEEASITALREEEEQKSHLMQENIEVVDRTISLCKATIGGIQTALRAEHNPFQDSSRLQDYRAMVKRLHSCRDVGQHLAPGALIDVAKHLGNLAFRAWDKMKDIVSYTPVILDPNTANYETLMLYEDLTCVKEESDDEYPLRSSRVPDNPERMNQLNWVLGSEGFNSGYHSWDVEIGHSQTEDWALGVWEYFPRQGHIQPVRGRFWGIAAHSNSSLGVITDRSCTELRGTHIPWEGIRVHLDCDRGMLWFTDLDADTLILYTYTLTFTEPLFPFFSATDITLKVLPARAYVHTE